MARYLVTGGAGFIGRHLVASLLASGHAVTVLDIADAGGHGQIPDGAELLIGDVANEQIVDEAFIGIDGCFHLAAVSSVQQSIAHGVATSRTNILGAITVFSRASRLDHSPVPVVYASSAAVYGDTRARFAHEELPPNPRSPYAADKLAAEHHARVLGRLRGLPSFGLRIFNAYGAGQDPRSPYSGVVAKFIDRISANSALTIYGDGGQVRDFVHISDVIRHLRRALDFAAPNGPVCNVCTGEPTTVLDLANSLMDVFDKRVDLEFAQGRDGEIRRSVGSPARSIELLNVDAKTSLVSGLRGLVQHECN